MIMSLTIWINVGMCHRENYSNYLTGWNRRALNHVNSDTVDLLCVYSLGPHALLVHYIQRTEILGIPFSTYLAIYKTLSNVNL